MQIISLAQQFIAKIKRLQNQFPERAKTFAPASKLLWTKAERDLNSALPPVLKELLQFSNGLQLGGFELFGLANPQLDDLVDENQAYRDLPSPKKDDLLLFMKNEEGGYFACSHTSQGEGQSVYLISDILENKPEVWASSIHTFFEMLLDSLIKEITEGQDSRVLRA